MNLKSLVLIFIALLLLLPITSLTQSAQSEPVKKWTLLIYLDADNNLEEWGIEDLNELEVVGSTNEVNVVVQFDRIAEYDTSNGDWTSAKRYYVIKDEDPEIINSIELEDLGEVNMGAPETLIDFVLWGIENYPAEHYLLDFWDHGGSWQGVCWDDTNDDFLSMPEIEYALQAVRAEINKNIDIVLFDACTMANTAVFYQLRNYVDIAVGSEASVPGDGCPYDKILSPLVENPAMEPHKLAEIIVDAYIHSYSDGEADPEDVNWFTFSAFNLKRFDELAIRIDELCMLLSKNAALFPEGYNLRIVRSRKNAQTFIPYVPSVFPNVLTSMIDLDDFTNEISREPGIDPRAKAKAEQLRSIFEELRLAEGHGNVFPQAQGLTIYFPNDKLATEYRKSYDDVAFASDKYWDEFIHLVNNMENAENTPPTCLVLSPARWEIINKENYLIKGSAFDVESLKEVQLKIDNGKWLTVEGLEEWSYNWRTYPGRHKIYARSFDGAQYSTEFELEVEVLGVKKEGAQTPFWLVIGIILVFVAFIFLLIIIRARKKGASGKVS